MWIFTTLGNIIGGILGLAMIPVLFVMIRLLYSTCSYLIGVGLDYFVAGFNYVFGSVFTAGDVLDAFLSIGYGIWWILHFIFSPILYVLEWVFDLIF